MMLPPDDSKSFEDALAEPEAAHYCLRLFVSGNTPMSVRAIRNIRALCEELLTGRYELAVIDICQHPETASLEQIIVTPTLVKLLPSPSRRIVGDLSDRNRLMAGLGVATGGMMVRSPARIDEFRRKRNGF